MSREFTVKPLSAERVTQAYPLVQTNDPELGLEAWRDYALEHVRTRGDGRHSHGILIAENEGGFIVGLVAYHDAIDLHHGPVLVAEHLLAFDLLDRNLIVKRLTAELERIAGDHGYKAIHTTLPEAAPSRGGHWLRNFLEARGHHVEGMSMCKPLA